MKVKVLGTGDAFSRSRYNTAFIISLTEKLAFDCPHPYLKILHENNVDPVNINDIVISHMHGDHISGLDTFMYYKRFVEGKKINIYSDHGHALGKHLESLGINVSDFCNLYPSNFRLNLFDIQSRVVSHYVPSSCFMVSSQDRSVGFSGDMGFNPEILEWLCQADLVFHEVGPAPGHTPYGDLYTKLKQMGGNIKDKVRLVHYSDQFDILSSGIICARDGKIYEI